MAVTRIKNNQITDATIVASTKLVNNSITAGKLENNLTYGSNLTITGNLTVNGATTTVSTTNTTVEDAIMVLNSDASGAYSNDAGVYLERGDNTSVFMGYDGSASQFALVETDSAGTVSAVNVTDYADLRLGGLTADDAITATGNVTGGNLVTSADVTTATVTASSTVTATGNVTGGNLTTAGLVSTGDLTLSGNVTSGLNVDGATVLAGNFTVAASQTIEFNENILGNIGTPVANGDAANKQYVDDALSSVFTVTDGTTNQTIADGDTLTFSGTANEIEVAVSATDTVTIGLPNDVTIGNDLTVTGDLIVNGTTTTVNSTVSTLVDPIFQIGRGADDAALSSDDNKDRGLTMYYYDGSEKFAFMGWDNSASTISFYSDASNTSEVISGTKAALDAASLAVSGTVVATGNVQGGNIVSDADVTTVTVTATGNVAGGNLTTGAQVVATGNITGGNLITGAQVVATGNVNGGNLVTSALVSAADVSASATITATGNITGGNLITAGILSTASILESATDVVINETGADVNFRVESDNNTHMLFVDAGSDAVLVGGSSVTTDVSFKVATTDSIMIPTGNTAQRPSTGVVGMMRWNTSIDSLEQYSSVDGWEAVGAPAFTVIASQAFDGDNSTVAFTLSESQTTASCIVSINGVVQLPTTAYSVSGTTLTFTEAPLSGDKIEVRKITTTTTLTNLSSTSGGATVEVNNETEVDIKGNLMPAADSTYSIGNSTVRWTDIYVDAGTIHLGAIQLKESGGELAIFASDGTTAADITAGSLGAVSADNINNGTTNVTAASGGDVTFTIGGTAILSVDSTGIINEQADGTGNIGNATVGFNTVFAKATSAQYADLAEKYTADADYEPGTVVHFGGDAEVTSCDADHCTKVAGVVSTSPAYRMNDGLEAEHVAMVALQGRVPCKVQGPVAKGDMMVSAGNGAARAEANPKVGAVIGKALEDFNGEEGTIEVVVGKH